ncbi:hypothetical protein C8J57DRAFT_1726019 [Mycena rebaudengoi]|nr:hypothetical protein C8J57DRAFT_1726019 [Mycena rebaudengoi]
MQCWRSFRRAVAQSDSLPIPARESKATRSIHRESRRVTATTPTAHHKLRRAPFAPAQARAFLFATVSIFAPHNQRLPHAQRPRWAFPIANHSRVERSLFSVLRAWTHSQDHTRRHRRARHLRQSLPIACTALVVSPPITFNHPCPYRSPAPPRIRRILYLLVRRINPPCRRTPLGDYDARRRGCGKHTDDSTGICSPCVHDSALGRRRPHGRRTVAILNATTNSARDNVQKTPVPSI